MTEKVVLEDPEKGVDSWPNQLLRGLNDMRSNNTLCDVVISTQDDKYYSVHSSVLGASSAFFCQILNQSKSSGVGIIIKLEKQSHLVAAMIDFLYTGQMTLDSSELEEFRQMVEGYGISHLTDLCGDKQYVMTLGNLVKPKVVDIPEEEQAVPDESVNELEYAEAEPISSEDPDLSAVEIQMENIQKSIESSSAITNSRARNSRVFSQPRTYNSGGPRKTWRDYKYTCSYCSKVFTSLSRMHGHQALHTGEKRHECMICGQKFIQIEYLREHVSIHSASKPFSCDHCDQSFRLKRHLKKHLQTHDTSKKFECELCGKLFKRQLGLVQHQRIHNGEKPFQCPVCERFFRHKEALHRHRTTVHRDNCPFRCGFCNVGFRQLASLRDHQKFCSSAAKQRHLVCDYCKKIFQTKHTLNRHIQMKHPGKPSNYEKVGEEEILKAACRNRDDNDDTVVGLETNEVEVVNVLEEPEDGLLVEQDAEDAGEVILQGLEKGIVLADGNDLQIEDEDGETVYQVLTFEMADEDGNTVITTAPVVSIVQDDDS